MIELTRGDLLKAPVEALVNTVNTEGVMGKGIALQFKKAFPDNFDAYRKACERHEVTPGKVFVHRNQSLVGPKYILNFPTKRHWRDRARVDDIAAGLNDLVNQIEHLGIRSIAIPPLGCGYGGLAWHTVYPLIEEAVSGLTETRVMVFEPAGAPPAGEIVDNTTRPKMTDGRAALMLAMERYISTGWEYKLSLLELQKLAYFLQEAGLNLRLKFRPLIYGPYADELRHVLNRIEGHFVVGFGDGKNAPGTPLEPKADAIEEARRFAAGKANVHAHLESVARLIENFETPFGMELLSSVHWITRYGIHGQAARTPEETIRQLHSWNDRKARVFGGNHVDLAWTQLKDQGWLNFA